MKTFVIALFLSLTLFFSCTKADDCDDQITENFYKLSRNVIFSDSLLNNKQNWTFDLDWHRGYCDSVQYCDAKIDSGLYIYTGGKYCDGCIEKVSIPITIGNSSYLAAEVKFRDFLISKGHTGSTFADNIFYFGANGKMLSFGGDYQSDPSGFNNEVDINVGGHVVHFLLDIKNSKTYAYSDATIMMVGGYPAPAGTNLSQLTVLNSPNGMLVKDEIIFTCRNGFVDLVGPVASQLSIEYIILYIPKTPC